MATPLVWDRILQLVAEAIDAKRVPPDATIASGGANKIALDDASRWEVFTHGGRNPTGIGAVKWAVRAVELGAGEILLTSMDADGQLAGYDVELTRTVAQVVPIPVIASGGAGNLEHLHQAFTEGDADAVLAASILHFGTYSNEQAKKYLATRGVPVRRLAAQD